MNTIYTGNYFECKSGNLISISRDKGEDAGFDGKYIMEFAPKREFFKKWRSNIGIIPEEENNRYYINEYYKQVLSQIDIPALLKGEKNPILLCYEKEGQFCHRHVLAEYIELMYNIKVSDIRVDEKQNIEVVERPKYIKPMLERAIIENFLSIDSEKIHPETLNKNKELIFKIIPELKAEDGFDQRSPWHIYDVWNHTLAALSNSGQDLELRLALLLHDIGKPTSFQDDGSVRHFKGHAQKSAEIASKVLNRLDYNEEQRKRICYLINNHSTIINVDEINESNIDITKKLLELQYCDTKGYNPEKIGPVINRLNGIKKQLEIHKNPSYGYDEYC